MDLVFDTRKFEVVAGCATIDTKQSCIMKIIMGIGLNNIIQYNIKYNTVYFFLLVKFNFIFELLLFYQ